MPQQAEGIRIEPPVSLPIAPRHMPLTTAAAEPPLEPPATRLLSHGLYVCGVYVPYANSWVLVLPMIMAPALRYRYTTAASSGSIDPASTCEPPVACTSFTAIRS